MQMKENSSLAAVALCLLMATTVTCVTAFLPPGPIGLPARSMSMSKTTVATHLFPVETSVTTTILGETVISASKTTTATASFSSLLLLSDLDASSIVDTVRNVAAAITAILFGFAGLTLLMANIIIPAAAKELEKECLELAPELWQEYQAKLNPGETSIAQRPELMQELGSRLQPVLDEKIRQMEMNNQTPTTTTTTTTTKDDEDD